MRNEACQADSRGPELERWPLLSRNRVRRLLEVASITVFRHATVRLQAGKSP